MSGCNTSCVLILLLMLVLYSPVCEWLPGVLFSSLLMILVLHSSGSEWLLSLAVVYTYEWFLFSSLQPVSGCCALLFFLSLLMIPILFSSLWVSAIPCYVSNLLMIPVLLSSGSESLLCLVIFRPTENSCPWLSSLSVAAMTFCVSSLLTAPVLGSPVGKCVSCLTVL